MSFTNRYRCFFDIRQPHDDTTTSSIYYYIVIRRHVQRNRKIIYRTLTENEKYWTNNAAPTTIPTGSRRKLDTMTTGEERRPIIFHEKKFGIDSAANVYFYKYMLYGT